MANAFQPLREYAGAMGMLVLADEDALGRYEKAVERFVRDGAAGALMRGSLALGIDAGSVRWHVANRGMRMMCTY